MNNELLWERLEETKDEENPNPHLKTNSLYRKVKTLIVYIYTGLNRVQKGKSAFLFSFDEIRVVDVTFWLQLN